MSVLVSQGPGEAGTSGKEGTDVSNNSDRGWSGDSWGSGGHQCWEADEST